jgi:phage shock protein A
VSKIQQLQQQLEEEKDRASKAEAAKAQLEARIRSLQVRPPPLLCLFFLLLFYV